MFYLLGELALFGASWEPYLSMQIARERDYHID